jgi:hypothetical protein
MSSRVVQREEPCIVDSIKLWEGMQARIALSKEDWTRSKDCIRKALEIVRGFEVGGKDL